MASVSEQKVFTGNIAYIEIDNFTVGLCQQISSRRLFNAEPLQGVGQWLPAEIMQQKFLGQLTVSKFFIRKKDLASLGFVRLSKDILRMGLIDIKIYDITANSRTGVLARECIRVYKSCVCHEYAEDIRANAIAGENAVWLFRDCVATADSSVPPALRTWVTAR